MHCRDRNNHPLQHVSPAAVPKSADVAIKYDGCIATGNYDRPAGASVQFGERLADLAGRPYGQ